MPTRLYIRSFDHSSLYLKVATAVCVGLQPRLLIKCCGFLSAKQALTAFLPTVI